eukprot:TRINITY_DN12625_c0_g1_i2.p1 TRINITY_DN12625_c0_g1~~TRINITY_DN12625_c0_g1_i2.p1  ORF type:complete len:471 (+),score=83.33 TRINITY_DN12625_c0_g1_i2:64-1476(+)
MSQQEQYLSGAKVVFLANKPPKLKKWVKAAGGEIGITAKEDTTHIVIVKNKNTKVVPIPACCEAVVVTGAWLEACQAEGALVPTENYKAEEKRKSSASPQPTPPMKKQKFSATSVEQSLAPTNPLYSFWEHITSQDWVPTELAKLGIDKNLPLKNMKAHHFASAEALIESVVMSGEEQSPALYQRIIPGGVLSHAEEAIAERKHEVEKLKWMKSCLDVIVHCRKPWDGPVVSKCDLRLATDDLGYKIFKARMKYQADVANDDPPSLAETMFCVVMDHSEPFPKVEGVDNRELQWGLHIKNVFTYHSQAQWCSFKVFASDKKLQTARLGWVAYQPYEVLKVLKEGIPVTETFFASPLAALESRMLQGRKLYVFLCSLLPVRDTEDVHQLTPVTTLHHELLLLQAEEIEAEDIKSSAQQARSAHVSTLLQTSRASSADDDELPTEASQGPPTTAASDVVSLTHYIFQVEIPV